VRGPRPARAAAASVVLLAIAVALLGIGAAASPISAGAAKKPAKKKTKAATGPFCSVPVVDNYRAPLEKLKPIPAVPEGGVLPFAPEGLTLGITGPQGILVGGSSVGLRLTNVAATTPKLKWVVLERLIRFSADGSKIQPAGLKRIDLKQLPAGKHRGLTFPLTSTPGIFSLEITIQNHRGRVLGRYGEYIRVVERTVNAGITLSAYDNVVPGAYIEPRTPRTRHLAPGRRRPPVLPRPDPDPTHPRPRRSRTHRHPGAAQRQARPLQTERHRHRSGHRRTSHPERRIRRPLGGTQGTDKGPGPLGCGPGRL